MAGPPSAAAVQEITAQRMSPYVVQAFSLSGTHPPRTRSKREQRTRTSSPRSCARKSVAPPQSAAAAREMIIARISPYVVQALACQERIRPRTRSKREQRTRTSSPRRCARKSVAPPGPPPPSKRSPPKGGLRTLFKLLACQERLPPEHARSVNNVPSPRKGNRIASCSFPSPQVKNPCPFLPQP